MTTENITQTFHHAITQIRLLDRRVGQKKGYNLKVVLK